MKRLLSRPPFILKRDNMKKRYGVIGLMEWEAIIKLGKALLHIPFSGGAMTAYGVTPAHYTTDNPIIQHAIENSEYYKKGKIRLLSSFGDVEIKQTQADIGQKEPAIVEKVSCLDDARDYLVEKFNATKNSLRTRKAIEDYAMSKGIKFEGI